MVAFKFAAGALLAGVASAHMSAPWPNTTVSAADSTTLTVLVTSVHTVYSCAATVTNCPAESKTNEVVVTDTIVDYTTVCPVTAAESISSSVSASACSTFSQSLAASTSAAYTTPTSSAQTGAITQSSTSQSLTTLTVYVTSIHTVLSCAASVTNCPAESKTEVVVTDTVVDYTTVCPVTAAQSISSSVSASACSTFSQSLASSTSSVYATATSPAKTGAATQSSGSEELTTLTVYVTSVHTVLSCAASVTNCPAESKTEVVVTDTIVDYTTICPVTAAQSISSSVSASACSTFSQSLAPSTAGKTTAVQATTAPLVTSTLTSTSLVTITECAASVTNCPAESMTTKTTVTEVEYTTVCPATEVSAVSNPIVTAPKQTQTIVAATVTQGSPKASSVVSSTSASSSCVFELTASGGVSGPLGELTDGQVRVTVSASSALATPTATFSLTNGGITDAAGRGCVITSSNQFQCDSGKTPTTGFTISANGSLSYNGETTFYACPASDTEYNFYTTPVSGQSKCVEVTLAASGCSAASTTVVPVVKTSAIVTPVVVSSSSVTLAPVKASSSAAAPAPVKSSSAAAPAPVKSSSAASVAPSSAAQTPAKVSSVASVASSAAPVTSVSQAATTAVPVAQITDGQIQNTVVEAASSTLATSTTAAVSATTTGTTTYTGAASANKVGAGIVAGAFVAAAFL